jgi:hypothetical protein
MAEFTGFRNNALPYPIYGAPFVVAAPLLDADGDPISPSSPDSEISKNGDTFADCTNEATEIATSSGVVYLSLTGTELTCDCAAVRIQSTGAKTTVLTLYPRKLVSIRAGTSASGGVSTSTIVLDASASAVDDFYNGMVVVAVIDSVTEVRIITDYTGSTQTATVVPDWNTAPDNNDTFTIYRPDGVQIQQANTTHVASTAQTARDIGASVLLSSGTGTGQLDFTSGVVKANTVQYGGSNITSTGGRPEVNVSHWKGTAAATVDTAGYPVVTIKDGTGVGEINTSGGAIASVLDVGTVANVSGDVGGNVLGSVGGDVNGAVNGSVASVVNPVDANVLTIANGAITTASFAAGAINNTVMAIDGSELTAIPWNASWDAEVQSEVDDALIAKGLDHLVFASVTGTDIADNSIIAKLVSKSATADWDSYVNTTDALEALRDYTASAASTDAIQAAIGANGDALSNIPWNASWDAQVQSEVEDALVVHRLDELLNADSDIDGAAPPTVGSVFHELMTKTVGSFTYDQTTDSIEAIRDRGDAAWTTGGGGGGDGFTEDDRTTLETVHKLVQA